MHSSIITTSHNTTLHKTVEGIKWWTFNKPEMMYCTKLEPTSDTWNFWKLLCYKTSTSLVNGLMKDVRGKKEKEKQNDMQGNVVRLRQHVCTLKERVVTEQNLHVTTYLLPRHSHFPPRLYFFRQFIFRSLISKPGPRPTKVSTNWSVFF